MKKTGLIIGAVFLVVSSSFAANTTQASQLSINGIGIESAAGNTAEVKMDIRNVGSNTADIIAAFSPLDQETQLHHFITNANGERVMKQINNIEVYPHNQVDLSYNELHVMLLGLATPLKNNQNIPVTLVMKDGSTVNLTAKYRS